MGVKVVKDNTFCPLWDVWMADRTSASNTQANAVSDNFFNPLDCKNKKQKK